MRSSGTQPGELPGTGSNFSSTVAPISDGQFYHFGKTRDVIDSMYDLQTIVESFGPLPAFLVCVTIMPPLFGSLTNCLAVRLRTSRNEQPITLVTQAPPFEKG